MININENIGEVFFKKKLQYNKTQRTFASERTKELDMTATSSTIVVKLPRKDMAFLRQLSKRMGWSMTEMPPSDSLFDAETGKYLNAETMRAIREMEAGNSKRCNSIDELLAEV